MKYSVALKNYVLGWAKVTPLNEKDQWFFSVSYESTEFDVEDKGGEAVSGNLKRDRLPIVMGVERQVKDWLAFRGSLSQSVIIHQEKLKLAGQELSGSIVNSTSVQAGASLLFDQVKLDALLGRQESGTLDAGLGGLFSKVSMTYSW